MIMVLLYLSEWLSDKLKGLYMIMRGDGLGQISLRLLQANTKMNLSVTIPSLQLVCRNVKCVVGKVLERGLCRNAVLTQREVWG